MDVLASAAMLEGLVVSSGAGDGGPAGERTVSVESSECEMAPVDVSTVDKENKEVRQRGSHPQVSDF